MSRLERLRKQYGDDYEPEMPEVRAEYLLGYLTELGMVATLGEHQTQLSCVEISKWQDLIGIELQPWEVRFIRRLSVEYIVEGIRARKPTHPEPISEYGIINDGKPDLRAVAIGLQRTLKAMVGL